MGVRSWNFAKARERPDAAVQRAVAITGGNLSAEAPLEVTRPDPLRPHGPGLPGIETGVVVSYTDECPST